MKIYSNYNYSIKANDMGEHQDKIANWTTEFINKGSLNRHNSPEMFKTWFSANETWLISRACEVLDWHKIPQTGGLTLTVKNAMY